MKLDRLVITDFGPYRGENEFDLRTTPDSPIILFGGKNGAGKTTLFNSVQLCLHGQSSLGRRTSATEYESEVRNKLHEYPDGKAETASVEVQFEYANMGDRDTYIVKRAWRDRGKSIEESLTVKRNGEELTDLDNDQWEDFLKELIPPGVSQLFFFDGEKVQQLATAIEENSGFEDSLFSLLGLDLVERLEADLSIYLSNKLDQDGESKVRDEIEELNDELDELEEKRHDLEYSIANKRDRISEIDREISQLEDELAQEGGAFAEKRSDLKDRRGELESKKETLEEEIREEIMGDFPFSLAPELCQNVKDRLQRETEAQQIAAAREKVVNEVGDIVEEDDTLESDLDVSDEELNELVARVQSSLLDRMVADEGDNKLATAFSEQQRQRMYTIVDRAMNRVPGQMAKLTDELEETVRELNDVQQQISRAPDEAAISPLLEEINDLNEQKGELKNQIEDLESDREDVATRITHLEEERERKLDKRAQFEDVSERAELASKIRSAVQAYKKRLTERKLDRLENVLTKRYRQLSNKGDFYEQIHIDKENLQIRIETANGSFKEQSQLSAGERQIFATALIWGLAEISDRPLPFIIDTPLGRLDKEHRQNLIENFFPEASHQVLVLSTDTEITEEYYESLASKTAAEYHLQYNEDGGFSEVQRGYFGHESDAPANEDDTIDDQVTIEGYNE